MSNHFHTRVIALSLLFAWHAVNAQQDAFPVRSWIAELTVKKDIGSERFYQVVEHFKQLDSIARCAAINRLEEDGPPENLRFQVQVRRLKYELHTWYLGCPSWPEVDNILKEALRMAYESEDPVLAAVINRCLMVYYQNKLDFGSAGLYGLTAKTIMEKAGVEPLGRSSAFSYDLGFILFHSREYRASVKSSLEAIHRAGLSGADPSDTLSVNYQMNAWNTIGLCYEKLGRYDSAFYAFDQALAISRRLNNDFWTGLIHGNRGDVFFKIGQFDSARVGLSNDVALSLAADQYDNAANSNQWLARIDVMEGNAQSGLRRVRESARWLQQMPKPEFQANLLFAFTQVFKGLGRADSMDFYMKKYLALHDSLETAAANAKADIVNLRMENQEAIHHIQVLNKEKRRIITLRNFVILLILLASATGYFYINRERLKLRLRQQQALQDKLIAEGEASSANEQLRVFTAHMLEKTNLVEELQSQLLQKELERDPGPSPDDLSTFTILTDADWEVFKSYFERVYPGFFTQLKRKAADISLAEQRMAALIRLRIPNKKSALILGISLNSVYKTRQRLRHRLDLETDADLEQHFLQPEN